MRFENVRLTSAILITSFLGVQGARAQVAPPVSKGNVEIGVFVGESYGIDRFRPMFGGDVAYGATRALYPFMEASYLPGLARSYAVGNGSITKYDIDTTDVEGGLHLRLVRGGWRAVPYVAVGAGLVRASSSTAHPFSLTQTGTLIPLDPVPIPSNTSFAVNFGGGLRVFLTERIAIRIEFKGFAPTSSPTGVSNNLFYRFAIGPIFQVR